MNNKNETVELDVTCPLCQSEEYLISGDGEKFTCADCGFHTKHFSAIKCLHHTPGLQNRITLLHPLSSIEH